jgi:glycosyltransferase involved in cell wall biosynthesis
MTTHITQEVLFVTSYPPRACGIATFSQDMVNAIRKIFGATFSPGICALEEPDRHPSYPPEVKYVLDTRSPEECSAMAQTINSDPAINSVCIQHEFGLFGGDYGENILYLLMNLNKPVVVTLHTVLPNPEEKRKRLVATIADMAEQMVVMTSNAARLLEEQYGIVSEKITVIPHGIHNVALSDRKQVQERLGLEGRLVLSTFGLMSSNKSIETALEALPQIVEKFPNVLYLVLGATHPGVVRHEGERYRQSLEALVEKLHLENNVRFVNKYLSLDELLDYLRATDIYLFTSRDPHQAVSGTFSYALGCACPVIATSIPHAKEFLGDAGFTIDFQAPDQLAHAAIQLLGDDKLRADMTCRAYERSRGFLWENVAIAYARLFGKTTDTTLCYTVPEVSFQHLRSMTDSNGLIQFSVICNPDKNSGYTLDDNARALSVTALHYELMHDVTDLELIGTYLRFIECCQLPTGRFLNVVNIKGEFDPVNTTINLDDANGRAIAALGFLAAQQSIPGPYRGRAEQCLHKALRWLPNLTSPRAVALSIRGLHDWNTVYRSREITQLIDQLARRLADIYNATADESWQWFEPYLTYKNAVLPESLLLAYRETGKVLYRDIAKTSFDFLLSTTFTANRFKPVSNRGWNYRGKAVADYGEQPIEAASTIQALEQFYRTLHDNRYRELIDVAFSWFLGNNHLNQVVYNSATGGCHDGIEEKQININQGAESTICFLQSQLLLLRLKREAPSITTDQYRLPESSLARSFNRSA